MAGASFALERSRACADHRACPAFFFCSQFSSPGLIHPIRHPCPLLGLRYRSQHAQTFLGTKRSRSLSSRCSTRHRASCEMTAVSVLVGAPLRREGPFATPRHARSAHTSEAGAAPRQARTLYAASTRRLVRNSVNVLSGLLCAPFGSRHEDLQYYFTSCCERLGPLETVSVACSLSSSSARPNARLTSLSTVRPTRAGTRQKLARSLPQCGRRSSPHRPLQGFSREYVRDGGGSSPLVENEASRLKSERRVPEPVRARRAPPDERRGALEAWIDRSATASGGSRTTDSSGAQGLPLAFCAAFETGSLPRSSRKLVRNFDWDS